MQAGFFINKHRSELRGSLCTLCSLSADSQTLFQEHNEHKGYTKHTKKEPDSFWRIVNFYIMHPGSQISDRSNTRRTLE